MSTKRFRNLLAVWFGILGVAICMAGLASGWYVGWRANGISENLFAGVDKSLSRVQGRVLDAQRRVQELKITADEVGQALKDSVKKETAERAATRLQVEEKAARLVRGLEQADQWMELSTTSLQGLKQQLEIASSLGAPLDTAVFDPVLAKLESVGGQLKQVTETADIIQTRAAEIASGDSVEQRINQLIQLSVRLVATVGDVDARLGSFADEFSKAKTRADQMERRTKNAILAAVLALSLLIAWMAAGQACLCTRGWRNRQGRHAVDQ